MPKNANLVVFWAKNPNFYWKKQKFVLVPTLRKNHLRILFALFFGQAWDEMGQKYKYLAQNDQKCQFWAKFGRFQAKNPNSYRRKQKFLYPHNRKTTRATCPHFFFEGHRIKWAKKANIWPNMAIFEPKIHFWGHGVKLLVSSIREPMRKFLKSLMFILEKGTFFFEQLFPVVARTWLELSFFLPGISVFGPKIRFLPYDPDFNQWSNFSLIQERRFISHLGDNFSTFRSRVMAVFVKNPVEMSKSLPPPTALALSARRLDMGHPQTIIPDICHFFHSHIFRPENFTLKSA